MRDLDLRLSMLACASALVLACGGGSSSLDPSADASSDSSSVGGDGAVSEADVEAEASCGADVGAACAADADCCSGLCSSSLHVCLAGHCGLPSAKCTSAADCCSASCLGGACQLVQITNVDDSRDRLLDTYATVQAKADRCAAWTTLDDIQKGIFLTHTDMLGNRSCMENASITSATIGASGNCDASNACRCPNGSDMALDHVFELWTINGSDPTCSCTETDTGYDCCNGGAEWHRIFFTADDLLIEYFRALDRGLPAWGASSDLGGPHAPFDMSDETAIGQPRGQTQFWSSDALAVPLMRTGVMGVFEPHIVELDNDYNLPHDSNPEGCYGFFGLNCTYGRVAFKKLWSDKGNQATTTFRGNGEPSAMSELAMDAIWMPRCPTAHVDRVVTSAATVARGAVISIEGSGFADCATHVGCGNVVHVRTHAREIVVGEGSPFDLFESGGEIRVQLPEECATGEAYVSVSVAGVLSNLAPITIAK